MRVRWTIAAAAAAFGLVLAGCGGSGGDDVRADAGAVAETTGVTETPTTPTEDLQTKGTTPAEDAVETVTTQPPAGAATEFCASLKALNDLPDMDEPTPENVAKVVKVFDAVVAAAPSDIRGTAETYLDSFRELVETGKDDFSELGPEAQQAFGDLLEYSMKACPTAFE